MPCRRGASPRGSAKSRLAYPLPSAVAHASEQGGVRSRGLAGSLGVDVPVGGWRLLAAEAEQGLKGRHRGPASVKAEDVLVEVDLQVFPGHAAVRALQPALEVADHAVHTRQDLVEVGGGNTRGSLAARAVVVAQRA